MKKWLSVAAIVVLSLVLVIGVACGGGEGEEEDEGVTTLKFGLAGPLTGALGAIVGIPAKNALVLASEQLGEFTVAGERYQWDLIVVDNQLQSVAGGVASATKLIFDDNVDFMHQAGADAGLAAQPICQDKGIMLDMSGADPKDIEPDKRNLFQTVASWAVNLPPFFDWLTKEHPEVKRIVVVNSEDRTGQAINDAAIACADYYGLDIVSEFVPFGTVEYYPTATKMMTKDPDLVIGALDLYIAMREMGFEGLGVTGYWSASWAEASGWDTVEGYLIYMPHPFGGIWPEAEAFAAEFEDRFGVEMAPAAFWVVTIVHVLTDALKQAGTVDDLDKIIETLETGSFDSLVGPLSYGAEVLNGIGHVAIWPSPIYEVVGEYEYRAVAVYTPEETEALLLEVYK